MKIDKAEGVEERQILIGLIVDDVVCGRLATSCSPDMFRSRYSGLIAKWCIAHHNRYGQAPKKNIEQAFHRWASRAQDDATIELVESFLSALSREYKLLAKESNSDYVIDLAAAYFNRIRLERLTETITGELSTGTLESAADEVRGFSMMEAGVGAGIDILQDHEAIRESFIHRTEPLVIYPGLLGKFFADTLERDGFIAFMGPEKRGKSFWLIDVAWRAMEQRRRVAFFEVGDMSQNQIMGRFMARAARRPLKAGITRIPISIERQGHNTTAIVEHREKKYDRPLSYQKAIQACDKVISRTVKSHDSYLRMSVHPNTTISVEGVIDICRRWERDGWVADVIVIDYADILAMPYPGMDKRDQINETWKRMRSLSQQLHCLVVTGTQSDAASYSRHVIDRDNFSDDKRKYGHVTGCIGLNRNAEEKANGVMRLNWILAREMEYSSHQCIHVAGCLDLANPAIISCF